MKYTLPLDFLYSSTIGFDEFAKEFDKMMNNINGNKPVQWPPFNIIKENENHYIIEMALAGFGKTDISIVLDDNKLKISGKVNSDDNKEFLYQGIAQRAFERTFNLNDSIEVKDATMVNGILRVVLENMKQVYDSVKIPIN